MLENGNINNSFRFNTCPRDVVMRIVEFVPNSPLSLLNCYFRSMFLPMFDLCSNTDVNLKITELLSPKEVSQLASCNSYFRSILPIRPLRVHIFCEDEKFGMSNCFFVTELPSGRMLEYDECLVNGRCYLFWLFDEERGHRVHMVGGAPLGQSGAIDLALMTRKRSELDPVSNKSWMVELEDDNFEIAKDMPIPFGSKVKIIQHDSKAPIDDEQQLQVSVMQIEEWEEEDFALWYLRKKSAETVQHFRIFKSDDIAPFNREYMTMTPLEIRASPVFYFDGGAMGIYSARSLEGGILEFQRRISAVVTFELWTEEGFLYLKAVDIPQYREAEDSLDFAICVPMVRKGESVTPYKYLYNEHAVLETMVNIQLAHWLAVKLYLATAADVIRWRTSQYERLESFSKHKLLIDKGACAGKAFVLKDTNKNAAPLQKPEYANIPPNPSRRYFCAVVSNVILRL